jgi:hypothetical protein
MATEVVNFRRARKAKARADKQRAAEANRALFGLTKAEKAKQMAERRRAASALDFHRRDKD